MKPVLFFAVVAVSQAATFTYNQTVTLDPLLITTNSSGQYYQQMFTGTTPLTLQAGDVVTGTISFANGPAHITNTAGSYGDSVFGYFTANTGNPTMGETTSITLLGLSGTLGTTNPTPLLNSGGGALAAGFLPTGAAADFTFTGFSYTINVTSVTNNLGLQTSAPFSFNQLSLQGQTVGIGAAATPEPKTVVMYLTGAFGAWLGRRKMRFRRSPQQLAESA